MIAFTLNFELDCEMENKSDFDMASIKIEKNDLEIEDFRPISRKNEVSQDVHYEHSLSSVNTREKVKLFLKFEEKYRKQDTQKSLTIKRIKQKAWKDIKNDFKNKLILMQEGSLVEYFHDNLNHYLTVE